MAVAVAGSAAAQDAGVIALDLNRLDPVDNACRLTFVADNALMPLAGLSLETVLFDPTGRVAALTVFDFADLPAGSRRVRQFDVPGIACADIAQVLINGVASCEGADAAACAQALRVSGSVQNIEVIQ